MRCPYCHEDNTSVTDSRDTGDLAAVRRRRECVKCVRRFTTYERAELEDLYIIKKDGRREKFDRHKLLAGLMKACEKRPISADQIERTVDKIESQLRARTSHEVPSSVIGESVMSSLADLDEVAYIRFASVYRSFGSADRFRKELKALLAKR